MPNPLYSGDAANAGEQVEDYSSRSTPLPKPSASFKAQQDKLNGDVRAIRDEVQAKQSKVRY